MKKLLAMLLALCMVFALCACGQTAAPAADPAPAQADTAAPAEESAAEPVSITLWTYPIGGWGNADTVDALIAAFEAANPGITVGEDYVSAINDRVSLQYHYAQLLVTYDYYAIALPQEGHTPNAPQIAPPAPAEPENGEEGAETPVPDVSDGTAPEDGYVPPDETQPE